ncbi:RNA polymerase II complex component [Tieghemostelium lacteum]|uniref:RNA polymerase II complex component n=1 Tax=Tieghemostelium lacteum TaxID=361077 RepID=A0A152A9R9_TIELA|nr:RNA polymerase II complex component [Tieghemostelium lacteum]|eukprot:KYR02968.1 RNA polymerase II complex component [Tieghemostelium lacteum]
MADPLTLLKNSILSNQPVVIDGNDFVFGKQRFAKNTLTNFQSSTGGFLQLHAVYLCHLHKDLSRGPYILAVTKAGSTPVALNDKKELLAYLYGEIETSPQIIFGAGGSSAVTSTVQTQQQQQQQQQGGDVVMTDIETQQQAQSTQQQDVDMLSSIPSVDYSTDSSKKASLILHSVDLFELVLTEQQQKEKLEFSHRIDLERIKPETVTETEDTFIESIKQKRLAANLEKSDFLLADEKLTQDIISREKQISDRVSVTQSSTIEFNNILNSFKKLKSDEEKKKPLGGAGKPINGHHNGTSSPGLNSPQSGSSTSGKDLKNKTPIIIVPSTLTAPLSLYNIKDFLQSAKFASTMDKKSELSAQNIQKPNTVILERPGNSKLIYEVYDNVRLLKPEDWPRVAAVFVQGEAWQFKDYKWSNPVDLLSHVKGYYLKFDDVTLPDVVKAWDVKILNISKSKRHLDQTAQIEFWNNFDEYILAKKSFLNH